jgi:3-isopropylmalate/(R)-2-methylmalate dehydratase small subunit
MATSKVVYVLGDDISTDVIYPGRFMATVLPTETPQYAFADDPTFSEKLRSGTLPKGSMLVAGANFGCGSSREQAVSCLVGHDLTIVAKGFARIFMQNAINLGLRVVTCPDVEAAEGDEVEVTGDGVVNHTRGATYATVPLPESRQVIIDAGGLVAYTRGRLVGAG